MRRAASTIQEQPLQADDLRSVGCRPGSLSGDFHAMRPRLPGLLLAAALAAMLSGCDVAASFDPGRILEPAEGGDPVTQGIVGDVRLSPIQPVTTEGLDNSAPLEGASIDIRGASGEFLGKVTSGDEGRFGITLGPGTYRLVPLDVGTGRWPSPPAPFEVTVPEIGAAHVRIEYDSGVRTKYEDG